MTVIRGRPFDFEGEGLEDFFGSKYLFSFYSRLNHLFLYRPNQIIVLHFFVFSRVNLWTCLYQAVKVRGHYMYIKGIIFCLCFHDLLFIKKTTTKAIQLIIIIWIPLISVDMYNNVINKLEQKLMTFYILFYYDYFSYLYSCQINYVVNCNYLLLYIITYCHIMLLGKNFIDIKYWHSNFLHAMDKKMQISWKININ
jgi:hypothetical protein